jgi:hypothetical protein
VTGHRARRQELVDRDVSSSSTSCGDRSTSSAVGAGVDVVVFSATELAGWLVDALVAEVEGGRPPIERIDATARRVLWLVGSEHLDVDPRRRSSSRCPAIRRA